MRLVKSHRTMGYELGRTRAADGREFAILQTAPHKEEAAPAHALMPVSPDEVAFETRIAMSELIAHARFLGLDTAALAQLFTEELETPLE